MIDALHMLGWTLVQFLWQGTLLTAIYAVLRAWLGRGVTAQARYLLACATLAAMAFAPVLTFTFGPGLADGAAMPAWPLAPAEAWDALLPVFALAWLCGAILFSIRFAGGWRMAARLCTQGVSPAPEEWQRKLATLMRRLRLSHPVRLLVSHLVDVPTVSGPTLTGWMRPVVLIPAGALTGMQPELLEALLAHELAHVRRLDYVVNILQSAVEALLFYHPGVWWISDQIRTERELCCDDAAVAATGDVLTYARALAELESMRTPVPAPALGASGASLVTRIRRLLSPVPPRNPLPGAAAVLSMVLLWLAGVGAVAQASPDSALPSAPILVQTSAEPSAPAPESLVVAQNRASRPPNLLLAPFGPTPQPQQQPPPPPRPQLTPQAADVEPGSITGIAQARVSGVVIDKAGNPVRAAIVGFGGLRYPTEADGTFEFRDVRPGGYAFSVQRTGFAPLSRASFLEVGDQPITGVRLVMTKHSVITGRVTDAEGDPVVGVPVEVLERDYDRGVRTMVPRARVDTDDRGIYRAANLPPGSYWVRAAGSPRSYPRQSMLTIGPPQVRAVDTFYPSALEERDAQRLTLPEDTELINTDIRLRDATQFTIRGQLIDAAGQPIAWQGMTILPDRPLAGLYDTEQSLLASRRTRDDGGFEFRNLAPGRYWVVAPSGSIRRIGFGRTLVTVVNDDVNDVVVQARTGPSVTVVVEMENGEEPPTGLDVWLIEDRLKLASQLQKTKKREPLVYESVFPTSYRIDMRNLPADFYVKSIHLGDADVTRQLFEIDRSETLRIVLSNRPGAIWGKLRPDVRVVLWPREPHPEWTALGVWPISTDQNGEFAFGGVDPGNYLLVALETVPGHSDTAYEFVDLFRDVAVPVVVAENDRLTVEAPVVPAARIAEAFARLP